MKKEVLSELNFEMKINLTRWLYFDKQNESGKD